ncbi:MAG: adenylate/guanylate cyclase domain-containing protein, partial [Pseudomonadota bacterium]
SQSDEPLKTVKTQDIAVLFVDIVGFTRYAADRPSEEVIRTLRDFHARMESEVFAHGGTLDKYLGDGLMATFGTPFAGERDATNAFECAKAMKDAMAIWNRERKAAGEPTLQASFGLHYGPAVLGDIGANRLEFAVIGSTVNVASRVEALTRALHVEIAATAALKEQVERESANGAAPTDCLSKRPGQTIRGLDKTIDLWTLGEAASEGATIH